MVLLPYQSNGLAYFQNPAEAKVPSSLIFFGDVGYLYGNPLISVPVSDYTHCLLKFSPATSRKLEIVGLNGPELEVIKYVIKQLDLSGKFFFKFKKATTINTSSSKAAAAAACLRKFLSDRCSEVDEILSNILIRKKLLKSLQEAPLVSGIITSYFSAPSAVRINEGYVLLRTELTFRLLLLPLTCLKPKPVCDGKLASVFVPLYHALGHIAVEAAEALRANRLRLLSRLAELEGRLSLGVLSGEELFNVLCKLEEIKKLTKKYVKYMVFLNNIAVFPLRKTSFVRKLAENYPGSRILKVASSSEGHS